MLSDGSHETKISFEHFFYTWGYQEKVRAISQDHLDRESIPDVVSTNSNALVRNLVASKKIEKLPEIRKN